MKIWSLKFGLVLSVLFVSVFLFSTNQTKAAEVAFYDTTSYGTGNDWVVDAFVGEIFQAQYNNVSRFDFLYKASGGISSQGATVKICEVSSISSTTCLDTPQSKSLTFPGTSGEENVNLSVTDLNFNTTVNHYYKLWYQFDNEWSGASIRAQNGNPVSAFASHAFNGTTVYESIDIIGKIYYDDTPAITGTIYWAGVGTQYGQLGGQWSIPFYWNICSSYGDVTGTVYANIDINGDHLYIQLIQDKSTFTGPQKCSGQGYLTGPITATSNTSGTSTIYLVDDPVSNVVYGQSGVFNYTINPGGVTSNYLDLIDIPPIYLNPTVATSTNIRFSYDFTGLAWSGGEVCLYNFDSETKTDYCVDITATSSASAITIPNTANFQLNAQLKLYNSGGDIVISSDPFLIVWYNQVPPSTNLVNLLGTSTHSFVCSEEDWNATSTWTRAGCVVMDSGLNIARAIADAPKNFAAGTIETIKTMFPFNIALQVYQCWNDSLTMDMPAGLGWLAPADSNGNIVIDMSDIGLLGATLGATSTPVWGLALWGTNNKMTTIMANLRALSTYLIWLLFLSFVIGIGRDIYDEIMVEKVKSEHRTNDWQL